MKRIALTTLCLTYAGCLFAADTAKEQISKAAGKLGEQSYAWHTTYVVPEDSPFKPEPVDGKANNEGASLWSMSFFDNKMQAVVKGDKAVASGAEGGWKSVAELEKEEGPARFGAMIVRNLRTPAKEAAELASHAKELKKDGDVYASELTPEGAKAMQTLRGTGSENFSLKDATGSVKFWLKDGALTKYEFTMKSLMKFGDNEFPNNRTTTVEIKDVGTAKLEIPEEAGKKLAE